MKINKYVILIIVFINQIWATEEFSLNQDQRSKKLDELADVWNKRLTVLSANGQPTEKDVEEMAKNGTLYSYVLLSCECFWDQEVRGFGRVIAYDKARAKKLVTTLLGSSSLVEIAKEHGLAYNPLLYLCHQVADDKIVASQAKLILLCDLGPAVYLPSDKVSHEEQLFARCIMQLEDEPVYKMFMSHRIYLVSVKDRFGVNSLTEAAKVGKCESVLEFLCDKVFSNILDPEEAKALYSHYVKLQASESTEEDKGFIAQINSTDTGKLKNIFDAKYINYMYCSFKKNRTAPKDTMRICGENIACNDVFTIIETAEQNHLFANYIECILKEKNLASIEYLFLIPREIDTNRLLQMATIAYIRIIIGHSDLERLDSASDEEISKQIEEYNNILYRNALDKCKNTTDKPRNNVYYEYVKTFGQKLREDLPMLLRCNILHSTADLLVSMSEVSSEQAREVVLASLSVIDESITKKVEKLFQEFDENPTELNMLWTKVLQALETLGVASIDSYNKELKRKVDEWAQKPTPSKKPNRRKKTKQNPPNNSISGRPSGPDLVQAREATCPVVSGPTYKETRDGDQCTTVDPMGATLIAPDLSQQLGPVRASTNDTEERAKEAEARARLSDQRAKEAEERIAALEQEAKELKAKLQKATEEPLEADNTRLQEHQRANEAEARARLSDQRANEAEARARLSDQRAKEAEERIAALAEEWGKRVKEQMAVDDVNLRLKAATELIFELEALINVLEVSDKRLKDEVELSLKKAEAAVLSMQKSREVFEEQLDENEQEMQNLNSETQELRSKVADLSKDKKSLEEKGVELAQEIQRLEQALKTSILDRDNQDERIKGLGIQLKSASMQKNQLTQQIAHIRNQLEELNGLMQNRNADLAEANAKNAELAEANAQLKEQFQDVIQQLAQSNAQHNSIMQQLIGICGNSLTPTSATYAQPSDAPEQPSGTVVENSEFAPLHTRSATAASGPGSSASRNQSAQLPGGNKSDDGYKTDDEFWT